MPRQHEYPEYVRDPGEGFRVICRREGDIVEILSGFETADEAVAGYDRWLLEREEAEVREPILI